ncbi:septation protein A [Shewanella sedimentimangrovi]|uniref:Inner membrane-spanning protein YciB n=1 Tax=Shewanella sedimentimangrovi TaxID=2814293 RepID=A0ABX7QYK2_9GAMM|nr:septation protein A [Shewanella sedimentimangrovi]QSX35925.1 septation protein A [Shewanella sedimentimangrovi]
MKQLLDFLPLLVFFIVYKFFDIYAATGALIAASVLQLIATFAIYRKIEKMLWFTFTLVLLFGSMTLIFHNDAFIKWKVTIIYGVFAAIFVVTQLMGRPVLKSLLGQELRVADKYWARVSWYWVAFFVSCGLGNIYVAFELPLEVWVNFKVFGLTALTLINLFGTVFYLYKHLPEEQQKELK